ncbi:MAG: homocysteine methyltransferase, partial [Ruminococcaceae bacterium]|nr:homocysteine methyltransferase [Oscillospiraceae bacterium]
MTLKERLGREWLFCDGGTGTILQEMGLKGGELPETWNLTRPDDIKSVARAYFDAGCNIVNTNTFGANSFKYDNVAEVVSAAVRLCREARHEAGRDGDAYVAIDIGPTGKLLAPMGDLPFNEAVKVFAETIKAGVEAGGDLVLIETMSDSYEAKAAVIAAHETCDLPVIVTTVYDESGKLLTGGSIEGTVAMLEALKVDAIGVNCGFGPDKMIPIVERLTACCSLPIVVNPNAGLPRTEGNKTVFDVG